MKKVVVMVCTLLTFMGQENAAINLILTDGDNLYDASLVVQVAHPDGSLSSFIASSLSKHNQAIKMNSGEAAQIMVNYAFKPLFTIEVDSFNQNLKLSLFDGNGTEIAKTAKPLAFNRAFDYDVIIPIGTKAEQINKRSVLRPNDTTIAAVKNPEIRQRDQTGHTHGKPADSDDDVANDFVNIPSDESDDNIEADFEIIAS